MTRFVGRLAGPNRQRLHARPAPEAYDGCLVLYRGYIANRRALTEESRQRGEALTGTADGELFVKAYRWWGESLQSHVLGEYAVAVFDERNADLLLTHDALGIVPVFYSEKADSFAFASHLEDLIRAIGIDDLDQEYVADYLAVGTAMGARTPHKDVRRLLPGESLCRKGKCVRLLKTWDLTRIQPITCSRPEEYAERFRDLLSEGVSAALPGDGTVWGELSGGLDSSSVVSVAAGLGTRRLEAISLIFESSKSADERDWMKAAVQQYDLPWHTLNADEAKPFSELPQRFFAEPTTALPTAGLFGRYKALAEAHDVQVILSGYGGDQVCCGDLPKPYYLADFLPFQPRRLMKELRAWQAGNLESRPLMYLFVKDALLPSLRHAMRLNLAAVSPSEMPTWFDRNYLHRMRLNQRRAYQRAPRCKSIGQQYLAGRIWSAGFMRSASCDQDLYPLEFRYPLLYRPLVEFMLSVPRDQTFGPTEDRSLQRRALKGILPEAVRQRKGKGRPDEAYGEGLRNGGAWTDLLLNRPRIVELGYVDPVRWREAVMAARFGWTPAVKQFVAAATLEVWLRQLEDARSDEVPFLPGSLPRQESQVS